MNKNRIIEDYLQGKHPIEQESWEMPSAKELERDEALFESLMAERKVPSSLTPRPLQGERELKRRVFPLSWRGIVGGLIAASIVIAFILWPNSSEVVEQPVVAEVVEQPAQEGPKVSENSEASENSDKSESTEPIKPKRTNKDRKVSKAVEEPQLAKAEPATEEAETKSEQEYLPTELDPILLAAAETQDIRSRGEHLFREVAQVINNH